MFSVIAVLDYFLLLEALKDSKNIFFAILFFVVKKMSQLNYYWKIIFLYLNEIWG